MRIKERFDPERLFFISDPHFDHGNIIKFCNRPFYDVYDMNQKLIDNWNNVVPEDGVVVCGGDFMMTANISRISEIVSRLNGKILLALGNHDYQNKFDRDMVRALFYETDDIFYITVRDSDFPKIETNLIVCHYPLMYWRRGYVHLHGHVHSGKNSTASEIVPEHFMRYDIGVDNNDYTPISYFKLKEILRKKKFESETNIE